MNFEAWLTLAVVITGLGWLFDRLVLAKRRGADDKANWALDFCRSFFPVLLVVLLLRAFVFEPFRIPSKSMVPSLLVGDFVVVSKFSYGLRLPVTHTKILDTGQPRRGDIAVFRYPRDPGIDYIKRIVAVPGDTVAYHDKQLYINGKPVSRQDLGLYDGPDADLDSQMQAFKESLPGAGHAYKMLQVVDAAGPDVDEVEVPEGHYFAMGDNRDNSADSRIWGFVPEENLVGRATMIWLSLDFEHFKPRLSRIGTWL